MAVSSAARGMTGTLRRLRRCARGVVALEFALILPVLLLLFVGGIEAAVVLFIGASIESAVFEVSRYGIVGGEEDPESRAEMVLRIVDARTYGLLDMEAVELETLVYGDFDDIGEPEPYTDGNGNGRHDAGEAFTDVNGNAAWDRDMGRAGLGGPGEIVVYRLRYSWGLVTPMLREVWGDSVEQRSSVAVRNEPAEEAAG